MSEFSGDRQLGFTPYHGIMGGQPLCPVCGLKRGGGPNRHNKCSKILQQRRLAEEAKNSTKGNNK